jgi:hypothetical protein
MTNNNHRQLIEAANIFIVDGNAWIDAANKRFAKANTRLAELEAARGAAAPPLGQIPLLEPVALRELVQDGTLSQPVENDHAVADAPQPSP